MYNEFIINKKISLYVSKNNSSLSKVASLILINNLNNISNIILPGGKTPIGLYSELSKSKMNWEEKSILLSDERLFCKKKENTNLFNLKKHLIDKINKKKPKLFELPHSEKSVSKCNEVFFKKKYLTILGIGTDGHIASQFRNDNDFINNSKKSYFFSEFKHNGFKRVSISIEKILNSKEIIFLLDGEKKNNIIKTIIKNKFNEKIPYQFLIQNFKNKIRVICNKNTIPLIYDKKYNI